MIDRATRKRLNARLRDTGNMQDKNSATLEVMQDMPGMDNEVFRIRNCSRRNPCNRSACQYCSGTVVRREPRHRNPVAQKKRDPEEARRKSRNYKARGGQWLGAPFQHLNEEQCYALTINFSLEELSMDGKSVGQRERKKIQAYHAAHSARCRRASDNRCGRKISDQLLRWIA